MYNEGQKRKFIHDYNRPASTQQTCIQTFEFIEKYELAKGADICTMSVKEVTPILEEITGLRVRSVSTRTNILKDYCRWCLDHGVEGATDGLLKARATGLQRVRSETVSNPLQLEIYLNALYEPTEDQTMDNIFRAFHWLAYAGMSEEDTVQVRCQDVDLFNMVIRYDNVNYPIYREGLPAIKSCATAKSFRYQHPVAAPTGEFKERIGGDLLLRGIKANIPILAFRNRISKSSRAAVAEGRTDKRLTHYRVWLSGMFYRLKEQEDAGIEIKTIDLDYHFFSQRKFKGNIGRAEDVNYPVRKQAVADYRTDYERWKRAHFG